MKWIYVPALLLVARNLIFAQGTVNFNNRFIGDGVDAPISYGAANSSGGIGAGLRIDGHDHPTAQAALYAGPDGATRDQLTLVGAVVGFRAGNAAGYVGVETFGERDIPNVPVGAYAMVQIRAWDTFTMTVGSYEEAYGSPGAWVGESNILRLQTGGLALVDLRNRRHQ